MRDSAVFRTLSSKIARQTIPLLLHQYSEQTQGLNILSSKSINAELHSITIQVQVLKLIKKCTENLKLTRVKYMSAFCLMYCQLKIYV